MRRSSAPAPTRLSPRRQRELALKLALNKDKLKILPAGSTRFAGAEQAPAAKSSLPGYFAAADQLAPAAVDNRVTGTVGAVVRAPQAPQPESRIAALGDTIPVVTPRERPVQAAAAKKADDGMRPAQADKWVNMRAAPGNKSRVLTVVPAGSDIMAEAGCRHWCKVVYDGKEGYIYKTFIR